MYRYFSKTLIGLAAVQLASAQLYTECNPTERDDCPSNPAVGDELIEIDFRQGASEHFTVLAGTPVTYDSEKGAVLSIKTKDDSPTMASNKYIFYGRVDAVFQAAPGAGIVTAITLQSEDLDEIDVEWVGADQTNVQSNYFSAGLTGDYDRGSYHKVGGNAMSEFHKYSLVWMPDKLEWLIDDVVVRTLVRDDNVEPAYRFPQTPSRVRLGTWVAGKEPHGEGLINWAGGMANFTEGPFEAYLKSVSFSDYANGVDNAKEYVWTDRSGLDSSIEVVTHDEEAITSAVEESTTSSAVEESTTSSAVEESTTSSTVEESTTSSTVEESTTSSTVEEATSTIEDEASTTVENEASTTAENEVSTTAEDATSIVEDKTSSTTPDVTTTTDGVTAITTSATESVTESNTPTSTSIVDVGETTTVDDSSATFVVSTTTTDEAEATPIADSNAEAPTSDSSEKEPCNGFCNGDGSDSNSSDSSSDGSSNSDSEVDFEPCDCEDITTTIIVTSGAAPTTFVSVVKPSTTSTPIATVATPIQTGWKPIRTNGVGFIPACEGAEQDDIYFNPTTPSTDTSESEFGSSENSSENSVVPSINNGNINGTVTSTPGSASSVAAFDGAASGVRATSLTGLIALIGGVAIIF